MSPTAQQTVVGCVLALAGMLIAFGLVRIAANLVIILVALGACGFVVYEISYGAWDSWAAVAGHSLLTGGAAALLTLPVFPFSSFFKKK